MKNLLRQFLCLFILYGCSVISSIADDNTENVYQLMANEELGDLFLSAKLRKLLDQRRNEHASGYHLRNLDTITKINTKDKTKPVIAEVDPVIMKLHGLLIRGDGEHTAWYNNNNTFSSDMSKQDISIELDYIKRKKLQVPVIINDQKIILKPGQIWNQKDNSLIEQFNK